MKPQARGFLGDYIRDRSVIFFPRVEVVCSTCGDAPRDSLEFGAHTYDGATPNGGGRSRFARSPLLQLFTPLPPSPVYTNNNHDWKQGANPDNTLHKDIHVAELRAGAEMHADKSIMALAHFRNTLVKRGLKKTSAKDFSHNLAAETKLELLCGHRTGV